MSVTVASMSVEVPFVTETGLPPRFVGASEIDCTRQVLKARVLLETPSTVTKMGLVPGTAAVALACPGSNPLTGFAAVAPTSATTVLLTACQVKGPTDEVISSPGAGPP